MIRQILWIVRTRQEYGRGKAALGARAVPRKGPPCGGRKVPWSLDERALSEGIRIMRRKTVEAASEQWRRANSIPKGERRAKVVLGGACKSSRTIGVEALTSA
jgi:hypothetical protein